MIENSKQRSSPLSVTTLACIVLGAGVVLIGLNYWHAMKCMSNAGSNLTEDIDSYIIALEKRVLQVETQVVFTYVFTRTSINADINMNFAAVNPEYIAC